MQIIIYHHNLYTAGVETLIVRMANWLVESGHGCSIVLRHSFDGDMRPMLLPEVNLRVVGNSWEFLAVPGLRRFLWKRAHLPTPDVVYTLEQSYAATGLLIRDVFPKGRTVAFTGAYHPHQFCYEGEPNQLGRVNKLLRRIYDRYYPDETKIFMSTEVREGHESLFGRSMDKGIIWPLPLDLAPEAALENRIIDPNLIVSVGRFCPFKTYNTYMPEVIRRLQPKYPNLKWVVYGFGQGEQKLVEETWKTLIEEGTIEFRGLVPYKDLQSVMIHAKAFIGMGTALLEAGGLGIPSIPAIAYDQTACSYGYLPTLPYYSCGEALVGSPPLIPVSNLLDDLLSMNQEEYQKLSRQHREYTEAYSINQVMQVWVDFIQALPPGAQTRYPISKKIWYLIIRSAQFLKARMSEMVKHRQPTDSSPPKKFA